MTTEFLLENVFRQIGEFRENPCLNLLFFKYLQIKIINKTKGPILGMECFVTLHSHEVCRQVLLVWMQQLHVAVKVPNTLYVFILRSSDTWHFSLLLQDHMNVVIISWYHIHTLWSKGRSKTGLQELLILMIHLLSESKSFPTKDYLHPEDFILCCIDQNFVTWPALTKRKLET